MKLSKKILVIIIGLFLPAFLLEFLVVINLYPVLAPTWSKFDIYFFLLAITLIISVPLSLFIWWVFLKAYVRPIKEFNKIAKVIIGGNLGTKMIHISPDELGELAHNINDIVNNTTRGVQGMANALRDEKNKEKQLAQNYEELNKAKAKDDALLGSIGEGVLAVDQSGKIMLFNNSAISLTGFSQTEAIGKHYSAILRFGPEKGTEVIRDFIIPALAGKPNNELPHIVLGTKDGRYIPITPIASPIIDSSKQIIGAIIVLKDITRERQLDKLKDEFLSVASHELRTPMTAIKGLVSMIFEGDFGAINQDLKEPLADISSSTERLIDLVNDMLDVSRIESGRTKYSLSEFNIGEVINEILQLLHPLAAKKGIQFKFSHTNLRLIQADSNKIKQILSNLIGNSLKFTDRGFIEVALTIHNESLLISVRDTGMGINRQDQKKLFSKFQQVTSAQKGRPVGTGLGLYISKQYAQKMGGDLWISYSQPAQGSVFTLSIPLASSQLANKVAQSIIQER